MTEKEKVQRGLPYNPNRDAELQREMRETRCLVYRYNQLPPWDEEERDRLLQRIVKIGRNGTILSPFHCDYGYNVEIGDNFFANVNLVILDGAPVKIGNNVFIAPNVGIYTAGHPLDAPTRREGVEYALPVTIGNDVWIGGGVSILPGVTIGDGAVVGAGSVVTHDIAPYTLAVGTPCREIRQLPREQSL